MAGAGTGSLSSREYRGWHLVDGGGHCISFTTSAVVRGIDIVLNHADLLCRNVNNYNNASIVNIATNPAGKLVPLLSFDNWTYFSGNGEFDGSFNQDNVSPDYAPLHDLKTLQAAMCTNTIALQGNLHLLSSAPQLGGSVIHEFSLTF